jgi:hypothetical protein
MGKVDGRKIYETDIREILTFVLGDLKKIMYLGNLGTDTAVILE